LGFYIFLLICSCFQTVTKKYRGQSTLFAIERNFFLVKEKNFLDKKKITIPQLNDPSMVSFFFVNFEKKKYFFFFFQKN
jgi:hypothetical protein